MKDDLQDTAWVAAIEIVGGHPALNFVNTVHSYTDAAMRDYLETSAHLIGWCLYMDLIGKQQARELAGLSPARGKKLLNAAHALRSMLYTLFHSHLCGRPNTDALSLLNRELEDLARYRALAPVDGGYSWHYFVTAGNPHSLLAPLAYAAAGLLHSPELARLKACPPPEGCGWLFLDRSRNGSRTWCNMKTCGNTAKQRRHRTRQTHQKP